MTPKTAARLARFDRSRRGLAVAPKTRLADLAASCGYADQGHPAREWVQFAGCPPSVWRQQEQLPFVQDSPGCEPVTLLP